MYELTRSTRSRQGAAAAIVAAVLTLLLAVPATPADARSQFMEKGSGLTASTYWSFSDGDDHYFGWLYAYEQRKGKAAVYGWVDHFRCENGAEPFPEEPVDDDEPPYYPDCYYVSEVFIDGTNLDFSAGKKLDRARLTGVVTAYDYWSWDPDEQWNVDLTWTGVGSVAQERFTYRWRDANGSYSETYRANVRSAQVSGSIGEVVLDTVDAWGQLTDYRYHAKGRTK